MKNRRLTEADAYALLRQTAMSQNRRLVEIAEAVLSMADMLKV
jgi:AmiR/NasT family two-component response regulator